MRESQIKKVPYILIIGDKEKESGTISYRRYGTNETINMKLDEFISQINEEIKNKK